MEFFLDKSAVKKFMTLSFFIAAALVFWVTGVLFDTAAGSFPVIARLKAIPAVFHGFPLICGLGLFLWLQLSEKNKAYAGEVINETSKVVWPSKKDIKSLTIAVGIMILIAGLILAGFDIVAGKALALLFDR